MRFGLSSLVAIAVARLHPCAGKISKKLDELLWPALDYVAPAVGTGSLLLQIQVHHILDPRFDLGKLELQPATIEIVRAASPGDDQEWVLRKSIGAQKAEQRAGRN